MAPYPCHFTHSVTLALSQPSLLSLTYQHDQEKMFLDDVVPIPLPPCLTKAPSFIVPIELVNQILLIRLEICVIGTYQKYFFNFDCQSMKNMLKNVYDLLE